MAYVEKDYYILSKLSSLFEKERKEREREGLEYVFRQNEHLQKTALYIQLSKA